MNDPRTYGLQKHIRPHQTIRAETRALRDALLRPQTRLEGRVPNLVILVRFANQTPQFEPEVFEPVFNGSEGSVKHYYQEVSYGQIDLHSTITPWIQLPYDDQYYAYNSEYNGNPDKMVVHAVDILDRQRFDFTRFDGDGDGRIDAIDIIHSGPGYENSMNSRHIHSHYSPLWQSLVTHDGIRIESYHTEPEVQRDGRSPTQIGVIVHETGHFFGLPDLYDYENDSSGIGFWGVMCFGAWSGPEYDGSVPTHFSAWAKYRLGWVTPTYIQSNVTDFVLHPAFENAESVVIDKDMPTRQFFIAENRKQKGFDSYLPGEGLVVYHVDETRRNNNNQNRYLVDVEQADGRRDMNTNNRDGGDESDPYPWGSKNAITPQTTPNTVGYGASDSVISVNNIQRVGSDVSFDVRIDGEQGSLLSTNPSSVTLIGVAGTPVDSKTVQIGHQGPASVTWSAVAQDSWIEVQPNQGRTPGEMVIAVDASRMGVGNYAGTVLVSSNQVVNSPVAVSVNLVIQDACPNDPHKDEPGFCGCGKADVDSDTDGRLDCQDGCPDDQNKFEPGVCGCNVADIDSDTDGRLDCQDGCPDDQNKFEPGVCGCGVADIDSDLDGRRDCQDGCPQDQNKFIPGVCGCGVEDVDSDQDRLHDCRDGCPQDGTKIEPGVCGCGIVDRDSDADGTLDCLDECPIDPNKTTPGKCGCSLAETDTDEDGVPDCIDDCPRNPSRSKGECGSGCSSAGGSGMRFEWIVFGLLFWLCSRRRRPIACIEIHVEGNRATGRITKASSPACSTMTPAIPIPLSERCPALQHRDVWNHPYLAGDPYFRL